ncbi:LLM class flavin-dependent oxidoreductase [Actinocrispum wychmicini]|uniref:Alkanesulfonate monooxygenase SsuD/methylene tetrahydromethanopterin reductase-like flavin-dependent oxidoreductase (Luciferase family) n=1 Tax=Actinocrispum wychmicini TaxID=1213861 RepID=A0A4R2IHN7_9PSEU|nr:LLM class flavin-dependent oxidoreductase [Actinocrispum wychmicini]TCO43782.1 alkanesulfonate monooxygenase SsuD/methylene tetrahydromethanopterin reductase-like flavin-dependent oxidoreductase (luciferase family) [Actinocrispum wychmicini]
MKVGLGLPLDDTESLLDWAVRADAGPFTTLGIADRIPYHNPEPLVTLAAIAGATSRVRVQTEVLLAPVRETVLLAKQAATLDRISGGRFTLGLGLGGRTDDYLATGFEQRTRGRRLDQQMATLRDLWAGRPLSEDVGPIGPLPTTPGGPEVLFGAFAPPAVDRVGKWGDGLLTAGDPAMTNQLFRAAEQSWETHGRTGRPRLVAQVNVAFGPDTVTAEARRNILSYYDFTGEYATRIADALVTSDAGIRAVIKAFSDIGAEEVMLYCWSTDPHQVDRIATLIA